MMKKKVYIIGAGIAGLAAGSYLQMNDYDTKIFEAHTIAGGLCTGWRRKEFIFDGCVHSTIGPNKKYRLNRWFSELIDFSKIDYHYFNELGKIVLNSGDEFTFYIDPEKLETELKKVAPEDEKFIKSFVKGIKAFSKYDMQISKPIELWNPLDYFLSQFKTAPYIYYLSKWSESIETCVNKCKNPIMKKIINQDFFSRFPAYFLLISIAQMHAKSVGYPIGGSLKFTKLLEEKYNKSGGKIHFNSKVIRVLEENDNAIGISLENGKNLEDADIVISAADGYTTIFSMLDGKYTDKEINKRYKNHPKWPSVVLVSLGIGREFKNVSPNIELSLKNGITIDNSTKTYAMPITIYNFDPTLASKGKTCIRVILHTYNFKFWNELKQNNPEKYIYEKERISSEVIDILENYFGNIKKHLEVIDVATPATFKRYTGNWLGSIQGWEWLPGVIPEHIKHTLPGLNNFYITGQWVMPGGGISGAFINARDLSRIICAKDKKKFRSIY
jgi:phytoene dehydrogenase-like protein